MAQELSLEELIFRDMNTALKNNDKIRLSTIRLIRAAIKNSEIAKRERLTEEEIISVLKNNLKKAEESLEMFIKGKRADLISKTEREIEIIKSYLPQQLSEEEIKKIAQQVINERNFKTLKDIGPAMREIMNLLKGKADGKLVNQIVRDCLGNSDN